MIEYPAQDALAKWSDLILNWGEGQQSRLGMAGLELLDSVCMGIRVRHCNPCNVIYDWRELFEMTSQRGNKLKVLTADLKGQSSTIKTGVTLVTDTVVNAVC